MNNQKIQTPKLKPLPPKIPQDLTELTRAITLLGNRTKSALTNKSQQELIQLIDYYPDQQEAALWKRELAQMRKARTAPPPQPDIKSELN